MSLFCCPLRLSHFPGADSQQLWRIVYMEKVSDDVRVVWRLPGVCTCNVDVFQHRLHVWVRETSENSSCITNEVRRSLRKGRQQRNGIQSFSMVRINSSRWEIKMFKYERLVRSYTRCCSFYFGMLHSTIDCFRSRSKTCRIWSRGKIRESAGDDTRIDCARFNRFWGSPVV